MEGVLGQWWISSESAALIMYLCIKALEFYYDRFAKDGALTEVAKDFYIVLTAVREEFLLKRDRTKAIETVASMNFRQVEDLLLFVDKFKEGYKYAGFMEEQKLMFLIKRRLQRSTFRTWFQYIL